MESINSYNAYKELEGCIIGTSPYFHITEENINSYHKICSIDRNCDIDYEKSELIDFFIISIIPYLWKQIVDIKDIKMVKNYGFDKIAFINKVALGEHIRLVVSVDSVKQVLGITKVVIGFNIEIKERELKAMAGEAIFLYNFKE